MHIDAIDGAYVAEIRVSGRKQGERTLRTEGPSCQGLRDALIVSLLLLLDDDPDAPEAAAPPRAPPPAPPLAPTELRPPLARPRDPRAASLWLELGAAGTHGLPDELSAAFEAGVSFRARRWEVGALGFWALPRQVTFEPGMLGLGLFGASVSGCVVPVELSRTFQVSVRRRCVPIVVNLSDSACLAAEATAFDAWARARYIWHPRQPGAFVLRSLRFAGTVSSRDWSGATRRSVVGKPCRAGFRFGLWQRCCPSRPWSTADDSVIRTAWRRARRESDAVRSLDAISLRLASSGVSHAGTPSDADKILLVVHRNC